MALEDLTGGSKYINNLDEANPVGGTDIISAGDDHIRGIKNVLKNTFANITGAILRTQAQINEPLPVGFIVQTTTSDNPSIALGYGTWVQIAKGRTLVGAGNGSGLTARTAGAELGQEDAILVTHTHTVSDPGHNHDLYRGNIGSGPAYDVGYFAGNTATAQTTTTETTGITLSSEGSSGNDKNMQPSLVVYMWERTA